MWVHSGVEFLGPRAKIQLPKAPSSRVPPAAPAPLAGPGALLEASGWSGHQPGACGVSWALFGCCGLSANFFQPLGAPLPWTSPFFGRFPWLFLVQTSRRPLHVPGVSPGHCPTAPASLARARPSACKQRLRAQNPTVNVPKPISFVWC